MADTEVKTCDECGASVYPEHIGAQKAGYWGGKLFCVHCFAEHRSAQITIGADDLAGPTPPAPAQRDRPPAEPVRPAAPASAQAPAQDEQAAIGIADEPLTVDLGPEQEKEADRAGGLDEDQPIGLGEAEEINISSFTPPAIKHLSAPGIGSAPAAAQHKFKRHLQHFERGAIRCRIFHAKLNDGALQFMQDQINDWIDQNPEVDVKHVSTNVGVVEGKSTEPHLIITVFY